MSWWHWFLAHFLQETGISTGASRAYNAWSGFLSDIAEVAILGGVIQFARHMNCHTKGCWRFGKPLEGTAYRVCHRCHPAHEGTKRNVPHATILKAHAERIRR